MAKEKPALRGTNVKTYVASSTKKREGLKGIHLGKWKCSDPACSHDVVGTPPKPVCDAFVAYGSQDNEGAEVTLEVFRIDAKTWEASARILLHPFKSFRSEDAAQKFIDKLTRAAFGQLTREDIA